MQVGKTTLLEVNEERIVHKNVWQLVLFYFGFSKNNAEIERLLNANATLAEKCSELEEKNRESELKLQAFNEKLVTAHVALAVSVATGIVLVIFPQTRILIGSVGLALVCGIYLRALLTTLRRYVSQVLLLTARFWRSASRQIRPVFGHLVQFVKRTCRSIRNWKWKAAPVSGSFSTSH